MCQLLCMIDRLGIILCLVYLPCMANITAIVLSSGIKAEKQAILLSASFFSGPPVLCCFACLLFTSDYISFFLRICSRHGLSFTSFLEELVTLSVWYLSCFHPSTWMTLKAGFCRQKYSTAFGASQLTRHSIGIFALSWMMRLLLVQSVPSGRERLVSITRLWQLSYWIHATFLLVKVLVASWR